jgi:hypothetical protein
MPHRIRGALLRAVGLAGALLLAGPPSATGQAEEPPLPVFHRSHSAGLSVGTDHCAGEIRRLTAGLFGKASLTHVTDFGAERRRFEVERVPEPLPILVAYTLQGPQNEVAILVCGPAAIASPTAIGK